MCEPYHFFSKWNKKYGWRNFSKHINFNTQAAEVIEILAGHCRVKLQGALDLSEYKGDQKFSVHANYSFEIETSDTLHHVCDFK